MAIKGRAETPEQKRAVIERLYNAWCLVPEQRLAQFICNATYDRDHFYDEDFPFIQMIEDFANKGM